MKPSEQILLLKLSVLMVALLGGGIAFALNKDKKPVSSPQIGSRPQIDSRPQAGNHFQPAFADSGASPTPAPQSSYQAAADIYNVITPGMTEAELFQRVGKPDADDTGMRPGVYAAGYENPEKRLVDEAMPPGRRDNGHTRDLDYNRGRNTVSVILMDTVDDEHPLTFGQPNGGPPIWVVLQYTLR